MHTISRSGSDSWQEKYNKRLPRKPPAFYKLISLQISILILSKSSTKQITFVFLCLDSFLTSVLSSAFSAFSFCKIGSSEIFVFSLVIYILSSFLLVNFTVACWCYTNLLIRPKVVKVKTPRARLSRSYANSGSRFFGSLTRNEMAT